MKIDNPSKICLTTKHSKELAIAPAFAKILNAEVVVYELDTDQLGTFSGEIPRSLDPVACAQRKCEWGMQLSGLKYGLASEGSFGPHPALPFVPADQELLYFIDAEQQLHLKEFLLSTKTNYNYAQVAQLDELLSFAHRAGFPDHGLILRPNLAHDPSQISKGIRELEILEESFIRAKNLSADGKVRVETDMRAHMNPTRMQVIAELAATLAQRIATACPACQASGWGKIGIQPGLACEACGAETELVKFEIWGCQKCTHQEKNPRSDQREYAEPQYCKFCNP